MGEHPRLARTRTRDHEDRPGGECDRLVLSRVQARQVERRPRRRRLRSLGFGDIRHAQAPNPSQISNLKFPSLRVSASPSPAPQSAPTDKTNSPPGGAIPYFPIGGAGILACLARASGAVPGPRAHANPPQQNEPSVLPLHGATKRTFDKTNSPVSLTRCSPSTKRTLRVFVSLRSPSPAPNKTNSSVLPPQALRIHSDPKRNTTPKSTKRTPPHGHVSRVTLRLPIPPSPHLPILFSVPLCLGGLRFPPPPPRPPLPTPSGLKAAQAAASRRRIRERTGPGRRPARAWRDRAARHHHRQGTRRAPDGQPGGRHPRADQERHLREHQPAHRPRHREAGRRRARLRGRRDDRGRPRQVEARARARSPRRPRRSCSRRTTTLC